LFALVYTACLPALALALLSLLGDSARRRYTISRLTRQLPDAECPPVTVIVPVKGEDQFLANNLQSLAEQDYPDYELIVTARSQSDVPTHSLPARARLVLSGDPDPATGEKINNLLAAVAAASTASSVLAFADSDTEVSPQWLRSLVAPLGEPGVGLSTGYRWHLPEPPDFWSMMRSVWDSVIAGGFHGGNNAFCWGGAMALRRETFHQARVAEFWRNAISDDFRMSAAIQSAGLRIAYAPGALAVDRTRTGAGEFLRWIERQMIITRVYHPRLWWAALVSHIIYCAAMVLGAMYLPWSLIVQCGLGMVKGWRRAGLARIILAGNASWFGRHGWIYTAFVPLATWIWLYSLLASARTNVIEWRGHRYRISPGRVKRAG
jgi:cellulose synthase/poly-beta-1,6-N-acetylglucosamine synthase-like glycosyltransferase